MNEEYLRSRLADFELEKRILQTQHRSLDDTLREKEKELSGRKEGVQEEAQALSTQRSGLQSLLLQVTTRQNEMERSRMALETRERNIQRKQSKINRLFEDLLNEVGASIETSNFRASDWVNYDV